MSDPGVSDQPIRMVNRDVVQIEFVIDDLLKQLVSDRFVQVASCNGCRGCKAAVDIARVAGIEGKK